MTYTASCVVVLSGYSMRALGAWGVLTDLADISEAAWRKRVRKSGPWLGWLLGALLAVAPANPPPTKRRVRLIDATRLGEVGGRGDAWRVHMDYDFTAGKMNRVVVTDRSKGEHLGHYALEEGDILVADSGYGYRRSIKLLHDMRMGAMPHAHELRLGDAPKPACSRRFSAVQGLLTGLKPLLRTTLVGLSSCVWGHAPSKGFICSGKGFPMQ